MPWASGDAQRGRGRQAAADQAVAEPLAAARTPALDGPDRPAHAPGGFLAGAALEVAEHDRDAVALGEPVDLLVEDGLPIGRELVFACVDGSDASSAARSFVLAAAGRRRAAARRCAKGDLMEPGAQRIANPEARGPS